MDFNAFAKTVQDRFELLTQSGALFQTKTTKAQLWETYIGSFPAGTNPMMKERTEHDCNCCKSFITNIGNVVVIKNGVLNTIWDVKLDDEYQVVADALNDLVKNDSIAGLFRAEMAAYGSLTLSPLNQSHFYTRVPAGFVSTPRTSTAMSKVRTDHEMLNRALTDYSIEVLQTVLELIDGGLDRGQEHRWMVQAFLEVAVLAEKWNDRQRELATWKLVADGNCAYARIRGTVIGSLLNDLVDGKDITDAVGAYEVKVDPSNYHRSSSKVSPTQIKLAKKKVEELGCERSLFRRHATERDININDLLYYNADGAVGSLGSDNVFDSLLDTKHVKSDTDVQNKKMEKMGIDQFLKNVVPSAKKIEVLFDGKLTNNLMSLTAPVYNDAPNILKWSNPFGWAYNGGVTDSLKERVKKAGGKVDGEIRASISWDNATDFDLHFYGMGEHVYYGNRQSRASGIALDVDANCGGGRNMEHPCENIAVDKIGKLRSGEYTFVVKNYRWMEECPDGIDIEIEVLGELRSYHIPNGVRRGESVDICKIVVDKQTARIVDILKPTSSRSGVSIDVWGLKTNDFVDVSMIMDSPNHWGENEVGNKHLFFILKGCKNPDEVTGLYNEYLKGELNPHRKVFEVLASQSKVQYNEEQLSGIGFSTSKRETLVFKVTGSYARFIEVSL